MFLVLFMPVWLHCTIEVFCFFLFSTIRIFSYLDQIETSCCATSWDGNMYLNLARAGVCTMTPCHLTPCLSSEVWINRKKEKKKGTMIREFPHLIINLLTFYDLMVPYLMGCPSGETSCLLSSGSNKTNHATMSPCSTECIWISCKKKKTWLWFKSHATACMKLNVQVNLQPHFECLNVSILSRVFRKHCLHNRSVASVCIVF